ncbi:MAG TPA: hypothetical protein VJ729_14505 [Nitrososphaeraceae archaeon]|nr:hypothetical protein [Nitrososphaeraceae archaeon]
MIPEGYDLIGDEYVRKIPTLLEKEINQHVETNITSFFDKVGYRIKKIPTTPNQGIRTVDYEYDDVGIQALQFIIFQ